MDIHSIPSADRNRAGGRPTRFALLTIAGAFLIGTIAAASASTTPLPRPNPKRAAVASVSAVDVIGALIDGTTSIGGQPQAPTAPATITSPMSALISSEKSLRLALEQFDLGKVDSGIALLKTTSDPLNVKLFSWIVATSPKEEIGYGTRKRAAAAVTDWPAQSLIRLRTEQALLRSDPSGEAVIGALGGSTPVSDEGILKLARAYLAAGQRDRAVALIRPLWREEQVVDSVSKAIVANFGEFLTKADHRHRMDMLFYAGQNAAAMRVALLLSGDVQKLATAWSAVNRSHSSAKKALDAVPASLRQDPGYIFAKAQYLRRAGKELEAAKLLVTATRDAAALVNPDEWWVERRVLSREMIDKGEARLAYRLAAEHSAQSDASRAEAEFHAGWYALRFLKDPNTAQVHFGRIREIVSTPISLSRGEYWLARAAEASGNKQGAIEQYRRAAVYSTTYYGQLALVWLNQKHLVLPPHPAASADVKQRFERYEIVQAIKRLHAVDLDERADLLYRALSEQLADPAEIALLAEMAEKSGDFKMALQIGKNAQARGLPVETIAFPTSAIPKAARPERADLAVVFALARQESAFHVGAISSAGARGLLQLMPGTAKAAARSAGLPYSRDRLTSDAGYNARLATEHLEELYEQFDGNYAMMFAAYNAGSSRVRQWIEQFGDPRDPNVDPIDWVERIPFTETRNYVQRTLENLQVYRARFGTTEINILADLKRGGRG